jgi:hypothetical protein
MALLQQTTATITITTTSTRSGGEEKTLQPRNFG